MDYLDRIILFTTGARFARIVFDTLVENNVIPVAIALPIYPPAAIESLPGVPIESELNFNRLIAKARSLSINIVYAPEEHQTSLPSTISELEVDYILVACWPYLLRPRVTELAKKAALNIHPSLLPQYRGANPISDQLTRGETNPGVSLHLLNQAFDQGDILSQVSLRFDNGPDQETLEIKAAVAGAGLFINAMKDYGESGWVLTKQSEIGE